MSETKRPIERTPKGIAKWITVNTPDTKFKDAGEYRVTLLLKGADAEALKAKIDEAIKLAIVESKANKNNAKHVKNIKAAKDLPYAPDTDKEGNETGFTAFKFKATASGTRKKDKSTWTFQPRVFDAALLPIDLKKVQVWGGSEVKVAYEMAPYGITNYSPSIGVGVSLKLSAVQVITLKTGSGKDAKAFGFEAEEGDSIPTGDEPQGGGEDATDEEF